MDLEKQKENHSKPPSDKRIIDGYEEIQNIQVAGRLVILAENAKSDEPYMVCFCRWDNLLSLNEYYNITITDDYIKALELYAGGIKSLTQIITNERLEYGEAALKLTAADCIPGALNKDLR